MADILIAEDEVVISMMISDALKMLGHNVTATCTTGEQAYDTINTQRPDLVLIDISMKTDMDGILTADRIKKYDPSIKVVFMTAYPEQGFSNVLENVEYEGYLQKPILMGTIKRCLVDLGYTVTE